MKLPAFRPRWPALLSFALALAFAEGAWAETLVLKDGTKVTGQIVEETPEKIVLKLKFGQATYFKTEIVEVQGAAGTQAPAPVSAPTPPAAPSSTPDAPPAGSANRDVLILKNGVTHRGFWVDEAGDEVVFDVLREGAGVSKSMLMRSRFPKAEVEELKKITEEERRAARKQLQDLAGDVEIEKIEIKSLEILQTTWATQRGGTKQAKKIELDHFIIESNDEDDWLRRCTTQLARVYTAYQQHFGVQRNENRKVRVILLSSMAEYYAAHDYQMLNPAYFDPQANEIWAGCDVTQYRTQVRDIKARVAEVDGAIVRIRAQIEDYRGKLNLEVRKAEDQIFKKGRTTPEGQAAWESIKAQQRAAQLQIGKLEDQLKGYQERFVQFQQFLDVAFANATKEMMKTLYHEGFHAFLQNFLFDEQRARAVPRWLNEGLAQYFENSRMEGGRLILGQEDRDKLFILRRFYKEGKLAALSQLAESGPQDFLVHNITNLENSTRHYLQSWLLVHWLGAHGRLKQEPLQGYLDALLGGKPPLDALPLVTGAPNSQVKDDLEKRVATSIEGEKK